MNTEIDDYLIYTTRMAKSMIDKAFFIDKILTTNIVDFGCSDGTLLKFIHSLLPKSLSIGYDINLLMLEEAKKNFPEASYFSDWNDLIKSYSDTIPLTLVCSSVIHEIYHYSSREEIKEFWNKVFCQRFDYIVIRDMCTSHYIDRPSDINDVIKIYKAMLYNPTLIDFEAIWGSIENNKNLIHFLLKCKYLEPNWSREVKENYLSLRREDLLTLLDLEHYDIIYHEHYVLPYIKQYVKDDFGIELKDPTHIKLILRRK